MQRTKVHLSAAISPHPRTPQSSHVTVPELELGELSGQEDSQEGPVPRLSLSCQEAMKASDGSLLGDPGRGPLNRKEGLKWQRPRFTRQALMRCCLIKWILSSAAPQGSAQDPGDISSVWCARTVTPACSVGGPSWQNAFPGMVSADATNWTDLLLKSASPGGLGDLGFFNDLT
ncbi:hypothetical protein ACRRTK_013747 [Alexandromys fortis]